MSSRAAIKRPPPGSEGDGFQQNVVEYYDEGGEEGAEYSEDVHEEVSLELVNLDCW